MTAQSYGSADPTLEPFLDSIGRAEQLAATAVGESAQIGAETLAIATVHARIAQAYATNRAATFLGDLTALIAELCERLDDDPPVV